jgi:starch-binding outer membrane protein SusE/F
MKKILKISSLAFLLIAGIACENDDQKIVQATGGPELLTPVDGAEYVLLPENASNEVTTLVWNHADYTQQTEVNYEVEVAKAGTDFAEIVSGGTTSDRYIVWTVEALNNVALSAGLTPFTTEDVDVRIKASLGDAGELVSYSNVVTLTLTPFTNELPKLWIPGSYQSESGYGDADWTHSAAAQLASDEFGSTKYEGYLYLANNVVADSDNGFKFSSQGNWDGTNYGDDGTFSDVLSATGGNIGGNAGYYRVKVDTEALTYNLQPVTWGIIGAATPTGWDSDTNMTYNPATKKWQIVIALTVEKFKFRYNDTWNVGDAQWNLGLFDATKTGENYGGENMSYGGGDISVTTAGTYLVELDLSNPRDYKFTMTLQ